MHFKQIIEKKSQYENSSKIRKYLEDFILQEYNFFF